MRNFVIVSVIVLIVLTLYLKCLQRIAETKKHEKRNKKSRLKKKLKKSELSIAELTKLVDEGNKKIKSIFKQSEKINNQILRIEIQEICITARSIYDNLEQYPDDIPKARQFLNYYIHTTEKIVNKYVELYKRRDLIDDYSNILKKTESTFKIIKEAFEKQYSRLYEDDLLDLNVEIQTLEKVLKSEGLAD